MNVPVKRHIKVTVINIPVGILITNIMLFTLSFLICAEACIDFLYNFGGFSCNSCGIKKILALRSDDCSSIAVKHFSSLFYSLMTSKLSQKTVAFLQSGQTLSLR